MEAACGLGIDDSADSWEQSAVGAVVCVACGRQGGSLLRALLCGVRGGKTAHRREKEGAHDFQHDSWGRGSIKTGEDVAANFFDRGGAVMGFGRDA